MVIKILHVILLASIKYLLTIPYARLIGLSYGQALWAVLVGGVGGFLFFYYLSGWINKGIKKMKPLMLWLVPPFLMAKCQMLNQPLKERKKARVFSRKSRLIVSMRKSYGLWGLVLTTPILLTIPLGAFLANKYYAGRKDVLTYMIISIIGWALVLTTAIQAFHWIPK